MAKRKDRRWYTEPRHCILFCGKSHPKKLPVAEIQKYNRNVCVLLHKNPTTQKLWKSIKEAKTWLEKQ